MEKSVVIDGKVVACAEVVKLDIHYPRANVVLFTYSKEVEMLLDCWQSHKSDFILKGHIYAEFKASENAIYLYDPIRLGSKLGPQSAVRIIRMKDWLQ